MYPSKFDRLRMGSREGYMTYETFRLIMDEHARSQEVRLFSWRHGPADRVTLYDYGRPRRIEDDPEIRLAWSEEDWNLNSSICNIPVTLMFRNSDKRRPGYLDRLRELLGQGVFKPSRCLDEWLREPSVRYCNFTPNRLLYLVN